MAQAKSTWPPTCAAHFHLLCYSLPIISEICRIIGPDWCPCVTVLKSRGFNTIIIGDRNAKVESQRNTLSNGKMWPWSTEWSRAKANRVLPRESTGHSKHPLPTTQEKILPMDTTRWSTPKSDWWHSLQLKMEKLYTVSKDKTRSWLWLRSWTPYCQIQT